MIKWEETSTVEELQTRIETMRGYININFYCLREAMESHSISFKDAKKWRKKLDPFISHVEWLESRKKKLIEGENNND